MAKEKKDEGGISKMDAVRAVLGKHGNDTMPVDIVTQVKKEHGLEITTGTASNYKGTILKEQKEAPPPKHRRQKPAPKHRPRSRRKARQARSTSRKPSGRSSGTTARKPRRPRSPSTPRRNMGPRSAWKWPPPTRAAALKKLGLSGNGKAKRGPKPGRKPGPKPADGEDCGRWRRRHLGGRHSGGEGAGGPDGGREGATTGSRAGVEGEKDFKSRSTAALLRIRRAVLVSWISEGAVD